MGRLTFAALAAAALLAAAACGSEQPAGAVERAELAAELAERDQTIAELQERLAAAEAALAEQAGTAPTPAGEINPRLDSLENRMAELEQTVEYTGGQLQRELQAGFAEIFSDLGLTELAEQVLGGLVVETHEGVEQPATSFEDGTWLVGADIEPGTYRTPADPESNCYMARLSGLSGSPDDIIMEHQGAGHDHDHVIEIEPTDAAFQTTGCGTWERVTGPVAP